jgi:hypothetical protein
MPASRSLDDPAPYARSGGEGAREHAAGLAERVGKRVDPTA